MKNKIISLKISKKQKTLNLIQKLLKNSNKKIIIHSAIYLVLVIVSISLLVILFIGSKSNNIKTQVKCQKLLFSYYSYSRTNSNITNLYNHNKNLQSNGTITITNVNTIKFIKRIKFNYEFNVNCNIVSNGHINNNNNLKFTFNVMMNYKTFIISYNDINSYTISGISNPNGSGSDVDLIKYFSDIPTAKQKNFYYSNIGQLILSNLNITKSDIEKSTALQSSIDALKPQLRKIKNTDKYEWHIDNSETGANSYYEFSNTLLYTTLSIGWINKYNNTIEFNFISLYDSLAKKIIVPELALNITG